MEYASKGSLFQHVRRKGKLSEREAFFCFTQACSAIHFLHKNKLMHRDIKPENLLLTDKGILKLCDFGCCTNYDEGGRKTFCGTIEYMPPEMVKRGGYGEKADVWSLGVLLYEMLNGHSPFHGKKEQETISRILENNLRFTASICDEAKNLIQIMLREDPRERPNVIEVFVHPWMKKFQREFNIKDNDYIEDAPKKEPVKETSVKPNTLKNIGKAESFNSAISQNKEEIKKPSGFKPSPVAEPVSKRLDISAQDKPNSQKREVNPKNIIDKSTVIPADNLQKPKLIAGSSEKLQYSKGKLTPAASNNGDASPFRQALAIKMEKKIYTEKERSSYNHNESLVSEKKEIAKPVVQSENHKPKSNDPTKLVKQTLSKPSSHQTNDFLKVLKPRVKDSTKELEWEDMNQEPNPPSDTLQYIQDFNHVV